MNLRKEDPLQAEFERSLERTLRNWVRPWQAPRDGRSRLMAAAMQAHQDQTTVLQTLLETLQSSESNYQPMTMLYYAPQLGGFGTVIHY